ncbi:hypothetical protein AB8B02_08655 [Tardiphaga sp. 862_B3_N4_1]|uniref:hypothetical protein n=1 Tax=Tardiphaga sp. 862_B3_N4_1 TaxID=3240764 RepID=UPI003F21B895
MAMSVVVGLTETGQQAVVEIRQDGAPLAHVLYDGPELEGLIRALAKAREQLPEQVAPALDPGSRIDTLPAPEWFVPDVHNGPADQVMLTFRHPGYGWLGFLLDKEQAQAVSEALVARAGK